MICEKCYDTTVNLGHSPEKLVNSQDSLGKCDICTGDIYGCRYGLSLREVLMCLLLRVRKLESTRVQ